MTTRIDIILPSDQSGPELDAAFAKIVEILDGLYGEPCQGWVYGSDDLGPNPTQHIRPPVHPFRLSAEQVRERPPQA